MASLKIDAQDFEKQIIILQNAIVAAGGTLPIKQRVDASDFEQQIIRLQTSAVALGASLPIKQRIDNSDLAQQLMALQAAVAALGGGAFTLSLNFSDARNSQYTSVVGF
jgi:predicted regulator of Ras-like GTPase activity (Roadblock/LC7/MglB family)